MLYFTIDDHKEFQYRGFFDDFGPPSLLQLVGFARMVGDLVDAHPDEIVHFYTSPSVTPTANSALYISFFRMFRLKTNAEAAFKPLRPIENTFRSFRDASTLPSVFD
jgi:hypothetical protein